ncbi:Endo-alpha-mannosidase [Thermogutta terrifontis]|uniref:Endo-alpha-mannosidase n=1 Tax=Thermogutta terrifontis TaxID=1331910 RepID=A0A286RE26_9BACT|nr:glycoside hydrolase family 99-like domain-containing protein [Thermogutta terrifontis]ASV74197.1 Endo-alpha-mannosidase [Thermogutta terrifontis]
MSTRRDFLRQMGTLGTLALGGKSLASLYGAEAPAVSSREIPRHVLAFYYPWYGNPAATGGSGRWSHWRDVDENVKTIGSSTHYPELGPYDSHDPKIIRQHCQWAKEAGLTGWIASWWGHRSFEDQAVPRILDISAEHGLAVTIYYETIPGQPKTPENAAKDIVRLLEKYAAHPAWLQVKGKPVVFIYGRAVGEIGVAAWAEVIQMVNKSFSRGAIFQGDQFSPKAAEVFDGLHTYSTAGHLRGKSLEQVKAWCEETFPRWVKLARDAGRISSLTVIPGYDDTKIRKPGLKVERYDGQSYTVQWEAAIAADPDWVLITSWNEWHEGSEIEPSVEDGRKYLELTRQMTARFVKPV